jgi:hypothetical protein
MDFRAVVQSADERRMAKKPPVYVGEIMSQTFEVMRMLCKWCNSPCWLGVKAYAYGLAPECFDCWLSHQEKRK